MPYAKTPADCGDRDCWYGRSPRPHKEQEFRRIYTLTPAEKAAYFHAYNLADSRGYYAEAVRDED